MYCSVTNLKYSKIIYANCVPKQSTVSSPNLLRSRIHPSLHLRSDFRPYFPFFFFYKKQNRVGRITSNGESKGSFSIES